MTIDNYASSTDEVRTYEPGRFPLEEVLSLKRNFRMGSSGRAPVISVIIPARNCGRTIGNIVSIVRDDLMSSSPLVDEILVVDHDSMDETAIAAQMAGARVVAFADVMPEFRIGGKGSVMRKGAWAAKGDILVFIDGDHHRFDSFKIVNLIAPLLRPDEGIVLTKGYYDGYGGGRSTETIGRAAISIFDPELAALQQPFSGEQAIFRSVFADLTIAQGWYIELGLLHQVKDRFGAKSIAQVDLEYKEHDSGETRHITTQVHEILVARLQEALREADVEAPTNWSTRLRLPGDKLGDVDERDPHLDTMPPLSGLPGWKQREQERIAAIEMSSGGRVSRMIIDLRRKLIKD